MGLVSHWFAPTKSGRAAGFIVIGSGFAIVIPGKLIPFINTLVGGQGWRISWIVLGLTVMIIAGIAFSLIRNDRREKGLQPVGSDEPSAFYATLMEKMKMSVYRRGVIYHLGAIYFLFGCTYVVYATFIVTALVKDKGFSEAAAGNVWSSVGFLSLFSGPFFGTLSDRLGRKAGFITVFFLQMLSYLFVAWGLPGPFLYLSIALYGIVFWSIPSIMAAAVGDYVGAAKAGQAFGLVTFIFGFGQITGPAVAGVLAERTGSFSGSFFWRLPWLALQYCSPNS